LGVYGVDDVNDDGENLQGPYASSDGDGNEDDDIPGANHRDKDD
jgi:hypothetical protein